MPLTLQTRADWRARLATLAIVSFTFLLALTSAAFAQPAAPAAPPPPPPGWTGSFGAGLALTQGNSDTSTINVAFETKRDTGSPFLFKSTGLFLRGESEGELTANRLVLDGRVDRKLNQRTSVFGQLQYLSDDFKEIDYLISPTFGLAQQLVKNDKTELGVDGGLGIVSEKNEGFDVRTAGAVTAGENFKHKLTATAEITQKVSALWKMNDFSDALYIFGVGLAANITAQTQLKAELLDTFKNRPPTVTVQKNDVAVLLSFVYKY
jgi:putative salt-induced outer membrane protein YdiY